MKNKVLFFIAFCFSLFLIPSVNASTKTGINIDAHEHFNYYYEQRQNTGFYQFLKTTDFSEYFSSSNYAFTISIFYASDIENLVSDTNNHIIEVPNSAKYAILYRTRPSSTSGVISISRNGNDYTVNYNSQNGWSDGPTKILEFFDENGNRISRVQPENAYGRDLLIWDFNKTFHFSNYADEDSADFTYLISSFYISFGNSQTTNSLLPSIDNKIIVTDIIDDGEHYLIDDNENYSGWLRKFFSFGDLTYASVVDTDLNYFKTNVIKNSFPSLKQILDAGFQLDIPEDYDVATLSVDHDNYIFIKLK